MIYANHHHEPFKMYFANAFKETALHNYNL